MTKEESFYNILFNEDEYTCFGNSVYDTKLYLAKRQGVKALMPYFSINPFVKGTSRAGQNIETYRNLLFEIDKDSEGNILSKKEQATLIHKSGMPFSTATWSGNKSIHWIVSLETPFEDRMEYDAMWRAIAQVLINNGVPIDTQVKDPGRFSRAAGAVRVDTKDLQNIIGLKSRISNDELAMWLELNQIDWTDYIHTPSSPETHTVNLDASDEEKISYVINHCMRSAGEYVEGNRDAYQFKMARLLKRTGLNMEQAKNVISNHCNGLHDNGAAVKSAYSNRYANDAPIYVWSKEEKREWAKAQEDEARLAAQVQHVKSIVEEAYDDSSVNNYFWVGDELMKLMPNGEVRKWQQTKFKIDFGNHLLRGLPNYPGFTYEPSYTDYQPIVDGYYNQFRRAPIKPIQGEWPTIHKLVNHVFGDQVEIGLDYLQLVFTIPKQRLPILCLVSEKQGTGKSTFLNMLAAVAGEANAIIMDSSNFESNFNGHYATKHIIMLDEAGGFLNPKKMSNKFKLWNTQKSVVVENKGQNQYTAPFFGKLIVASNDEDNFLKMEDEDQRYWVRKIPQLNLGDKDPYFETKIENEAPYFLHYLMHREMSVSEPEGRLWFDPKTYETQWLDNVKTASKSSLYHEIVEIIENWFFEHPQETRLSFSLKSMMEELKLRGLKMDIGIKYIKSVLNKELKLESPEKPSRETNGFKLAPNQKSSYDTSESGRFYSIERSQVMMDDVFSDGMLEI